jgi:hypothetical protein
MRTLPRRRKTVRRECQGNTEREREGYVSTPQPLAGGKEVRWSLCTDVWSIIKIDALQHLTPAKAEFGGYGGIPGFEELAEGEGTERRTEVTRRDTGTRDPWRRNGRAGAMAMPPPLPTDDGDREEGRGGGGERGRFESALCPGSDEELCSLPLSKSAWGTRKATKNEEKRTTKKGHTGVPAPGGGAKGALERRDGQ